MGATIIHNVPKEFDIALDLKRPVSNTDFEVVEGDTENYINITLTDDSEPVNVDSNRIVAVFTHSKGSYTQDSISEIGGIYVDGNLIRIHLKTSSFAVGMVECELRIYGELAAHSTTPVFNFNCRASLLSSAAVASQNNLDMLTGLIAQVGSIFNNAENLAIEYAAIPYIDVVYTNTNPATAASITYSKTPGEYMGIFCSSDGRPQSASDYTWVHLATPPHVTSAALDNSGDLVLGLTDLSSITVQGFDTAVSSKVTSAAASIPRITGASIGQSGNIEIALSDNSVVTVSGSSSSIDNRVSTAIAHNAPVTAQNVTVAPSAFVSDVTFRDYRYKATVPCTGMRDTFMGSVVFSPDDAQTGNFAPVAVAGTDCVLIYAKTVPAANTTILLVKGEQP